jgi:hypothetical protein
MVQVYQGAGAVAGISAGFRGGLAKGTAGSIGILAALIVDFLQKGDSSAFITATKLANAVAINRLHIMALPPYVYVAALIIAGFGLVFVTRPESARSAFFAGIGMLGTLAAFSPISNLSTTQTMSAPATTDPATTPSAPSGSQSLSDGAAPNGAPVVLAQLSVISAHIVVQFPATAGSVPPMLVKLHDYVSGQTIQLNGTQSSSGQGPRVIFDTNLTPGAPKGDLVADLEVRVEASGYAIASAVAKVMRASPMPVELSVPLVASRTPLWLQRTQYPYKW